ncbi:unnamed protein product, partial [Larinioides sclopetarius]
YPLLVGSYFLVRRAAFSRNILTMLLLGLRLMKN